MIESNYMFMSDTLIRNGVPQPGAIELLKALDAHNLGYVILTEQSGKSRKSFAEQMYAAGFDEVRVCDIYSSVTAACDWIRWARPNKDKATMIGGKGMKETLIEAGFHLNTPEVDWIFLGMNSNVTYADFCEALELIDTGAQLIVTDDRKTLWKSGRKLLAPGAIATMLEDATGRDALHFGRGTMNLLKFGVQYFDVDPKDITMVGTDFERDIIPALRMGMRTVLVTQGRSLEILGITDLLHPHYIVDTLLGLTK